MSSELSKLDVKITITLPESHFLIGYSDACCTLKHFDQSGVLKYSSEIFLSILKNKMTIKCELPDYELLYILKISAEELFKLRNVPNP